MIKLNVKISAESVATGSIVISLLVTLLVFTFFGWLGYAYFNPNTASGRFLIKVLSKMFKNEIWLLIINPWTMNTYQFYWSMFRCYMHILAILFSSKSNFGHNCQAQSLSSLYLYHDLYISLATPNHHKLFKCRIVDLNSTVYEQIIDYFGYFPPNIDIDIRFMAILKAEYYSNIFFNIFPNIGL